MLINYVRTFITVRTRTILDNIQDKLLLLFINLAELDCAPQRQQKSRRHPGIAVYRNVTCIVYVCAVPTFA